MCLSSLRLTRADVCSVCDVTSACNITSVSDFTALFRNTTSPPKILILHSNGLRRLCLSTSGTLSEGSADQLIRKCTVQTNHKINHNIAQKGIFDRGLHITTR
ncbi:unnamed protein product [Ixodes pacificus]